MYTAAYKFAQRLQAAEEAAPAPPPPPESAGPRASRDQSEFGLGFAWRVGGDLLNHIKCASRTPRGQLPAVFDPPVLARSLAPGGARRRPR